jgi:CRISPR-associated protein Cas2
MVVITLEKVPTSLRGELTRWLLEVKTGTFVGRVSAMVRDKLWELICTRNHGGGCLMVYNTNNEQGFALRTYGDTTRDLVDFEGITLIRVPENKGIKK